MAITIGIIKAIGINYATLSTLPDWPNRSKTFLAPGRDLPDWPDRKRIIDKKERQNIFKE